MSKTELLLVLANSQKKGGRCTAGKLLTPNGTGTYDVGPWVRPVHPSTSEGEIPVAMTLIENQELAPFDVVKISLDKRLDDPNHPEDWLINPSVPWTRECTISKNDLPQLLDNPGDLWGADSAVFRRVPLGYVSCMANSSTLRLVAPVAQCHVRGFMEDRHDGRGPRVRVRLEIPHDGLVHEFDVTDAAFRSRYGIKNHVIQHGTFELCFANPTKVAFSLSLTPPFNGYQYKIAAAIIEVP